MLGCIAMGLPYLQATIHPPPVAMPGRRTTSSPSCSVIHCDMIGFLDGSSSVAVNIAIPCFDKGSEIPDNFSTVGLGKADHNGVITRTDSGAARKHSKEPASWISGNIFGTTSKDWHPLQAAPVRRRG